jgi:hypothetical protein
MEVTRRNYLAATGAGAVALAATALPGVAHADEGKGDADTLYGHGMVWNRELPGVAGELRLSFDLRLDLTAGTGQGTAEDPVYPDWGIHFAVNSVEREKRPGGEVRFTLRGEVTRANNPANFGLPVRILAETAGDTTAIAIALGSQAFGGAGLIVLEALGPLAKAILRILGGG